MIDFGRGHPQTSMLPLELMQKSLSTLNSNFPDISPHSSLQYLVWEKIERREEQERGEKEKIESSACTRKVTRK
jgi:hypothetical protein